MLVSAGMPFASEKAAEGKLRSLRDAYEVYVNSLAEYFCLAVPPWIPDSDRLADWQTSPWERRPALRTERDRRKRAKRDR